MAILANHRESPKIMETDGNHGNGRGESRKITETALQVLVTTEQLSRYGAKMDTKKRTEPKE